MSYKFNNQEYQEIVIGMMIFDKYAKDGNNYELFSEHEIFMAGPDPRIVSPEDLKILRELNWAPNPDPDDADEMEDYIEGFQPEDMACFRKYF